MPREGLVLLRDESLHTLRVFHLLVRFVLDVLDAEPEFLLVAIGICELELSLIIIRCSLIFDSTHNLRIRGVDFGQGYGEVTDVASSQRLRIVTLEGTGTRSPNEGVTAVPAEDVTFKK